MDTTSIWPWYVVAAAVGFLSIEGYALYADQTTLSMWIRNLSVQYPVIAPIFGLCAGLLIGHLWRW